MSTPLTPEELLEEARITSTLMENNRIIQALYAATGNRAELFRNPNPTENIEITPENWLKLMRAIYGDIL
jgi:hypothetical protein